MSNTTGPRRPDPRWELFTDWCAAVGEPPLPAGPTALARFLAAHPAGDATQRRRVSVINAAHRSAGLLPPGDTDTVRELLDGRWRRNRHRRVHAASSAIALLPQHGWPTALFARRDAMILLLHAAGGMTATSISALRCGDVRTAADGELLEISSYGRMRLVGADLVPTGISPAQIWSDWEVVRQVQHQLPATRWTRRLLEGDTAPALRAVSEDLPLLTPLDRWGAAPLELIALSASAVSQIITGHLTGSATVHPPLPARRCEALPVAEPPHEPVALDPGVIERGLQARRRAAELLDGVGDQLDDVEARADALLAGLLELLEQPELRRGG